MRDLIIDRLEEFTQAVEVNHLVFYWLGGELFTLEPEYIYRYIYLLAKRLPSVKIEHHFQSNLLHYNSTWGQFLYDHGGGKISSSVDYPNLYRHTPELSLDGYVEKWIEKKDEAEGDGIEVSVISLPNEATVKTEPEEFYEFYASTLKIPKVQINLPFWNENAQHKIKLDMNELISFMSGLYRVWVESGRSIYLAPYSYLESYILEEKENYACVFSYTCGEKIFALAPNGDVVPCDYWITAPDPVKYGNIHTDSIQSILQSEERQRFLSRPPHLIMETNCGQCEFWHICHGGCPVRAASFFGSYMHKDYYCPLYKALFKAITGTKMKGNQKKLIGIMFDGIV